MKKLLMICAVAMTAVSVNAASYLWQATSGRLFDGQGSESANRYAGTGYLFNADELKQAAIIAAFNSEVGVDSVLSTALSIGTFASGRTNASSAFEGPDAVFTAYFVVLGLDANGNKAIYVSDTVSANYQSVGEGDVKFGQQNSYSSIGFKDASAGYSTAGWYSAAAIPEPTSGLLMLLGMAGLALKRKRA